MAATMDSLEKQPSMAMDSPPPSTPTPASFSFFSSTSSFPLEPQTPQTAYPFDSTATSMSAASPLQARIAFNGTPAMPGSEFKKKKPTLAGLEASIYSTPPTRQPGSTPGTPTSPRVPQFTVEVEPQPIEQSISVPQKTLAQVEQEIIFKAPPGQWFRQVYGHKVDITCLPAEIHVQILKEVTFLDQLSCERVCTTWRTIIRRDCASFRYTTVDDSIWTGIKTEEEKEKEKKENKAREEALKKAGFTGPLYTSAPTPAPAASTATLPLFQFGPAPAPGLAAQPAAPAHGRHKKQPTLAAKDRPKILIHRLIQDGNFAFRQTPETGQAELMSTYFPDQPWCLTRRFKIANMTFMNDPIALYSFQLPQTAQRADVPTLEIEFDCSPLRNEFRLKIGGRFSTASTVSTIEPRLPGGRRGPQIFPGAPIGGGIFGAGLFGAAGPPPGSLFGQPHNHQPPPEPFNGLFGNNTLFPGPSTAGKPISARQAISQGRPYHRPWDLGAFLLAIQGKIESPKNWHEQSPAEMNSRWNGDIWGSKYKRGTDVDGDWDMNNGFREPMTLVQMAIAEKDLLERFKMNGYWFNRQWRKDENEEEIHVGLTPVSEWIWDICF